MDSIIRAKKITWATNKQPKTQNGGGTNDGGYIWVG